MIQALGGGGKQEQKQEKIKKSKQIMALQCKLKAAKTMSTQMFQVGKDGTIVLDTSKDNMIQEIEEQQTQCELNDFDCQLLELSSSSSSSLEEEEEKGEIIKNNKDDNNNNNSVSNKDNKNKQNTPWQ